MLNYISPDGVELALQPGKNNSITQRKSTKVRKNSERARLNHLNVMMHIHQLGRSLLMPHNALRGGGLFNQFTSSTI